MNCCSDEVREAVVAASADIKKFVADPTAGIPGGRYAPAPDGAPSEISLGGRGAADNPDHSTTPRFLARLFFGLVLALGFAVVAARWYANPGVRYTFICLAVLVGVSLFMSGLTRLRRATGPTTGGGFKTWAIAAAVVVVFAVILGETWAPNSSVTPHAVASPSANALTTTEADATTTTQAAYLNTSPAETNRSGTTSINYSEALKDTESSAALLALIDSRPGYDSYVVTYDDYAGDYPQKLKYVFSSDVVTFTYSQPDGTPVSMTWEGHGIERLTNDANGEGLD